MTRMIDHRQDAIGRAYRAWAATQPQLMLDLWPDRTLDEATPPNTSPDGAGGLAERTCAHNTGGTPNHATAHMRELAASAVAAPGVESPAGASAAPR